MTYGGKKKDLLGEGKMGATNKKKKGPLSVDFKKNRKKELEKKRAEREGGLKE